MGLIIARLNTLPTDVTNISVGSRIILPNGKEYILNNLKVWIPIHMMALEVKEDLINEDLNTIDKFGIYHQNSNNNALLSKNYPIQSAGVLKVYVNNGNVFQEYQILTGQYNENQIYTRGKYAGYWSNWLKPNYVDINQTDYNSLISNKHTHNNKSLLDSYTQTNENLLDAVNKKHTHNNKSLLDTYTQTNENLLDAVNKKHTHSNLNDLNLITSAKINNWNDSHSWGNHNSFNYLTQTSGDNRYLKYTGYNDYDGSIRIVDTETEDTSYFASRTSNAYITNNTINLSGFGFYSNIISNTINNYWFGVKKYNFNGTNIELKFVEYDEILNKWTIGKNVPIYLNTLNLGTINQNKILTLDTAGKLGYIDGIPALINDVSLKLDKGTYTGNAQDLKNSIDGKANTSHTHDISNVTNLQTTLNNKLDKGTYIGTAQDLKNDIDGIQIGGRNLLVGSDYFKNFNTFGNGSIELNKTLKIYDSSYGNVRCRQILNITTAGYYTISFTCLEINSSNKFFIELKNSTTGVGSNQKQIVLGKNVFTLYIPTGNYYIVNFFANAPSLDNTKWCLIKNDIKVEIGNKATDWTPALEDKQDRLQNISGNVGVGKTDVTATEKLDVNGNVKANSYKFNLPSSITAQPNMLIPKTDGTRPIWYDNSSVGNDLVLKSDVDNIQIGGRNLLTRSDLKNQYISTSFIVDGISYNTHSEGYSSYNPGITNPTTSYHSYIDNTTFGFPVVVYNESNGTRHWKGSGKIVSSQINSYGDFFVSFDVYATGLGTKIFGGFYYTKKGDTTVGFHSGQFNILVNKVNEWHRVSAGCRLNDDVDLTKPISFYFYGYGFSTNSILYVRKHKLEKGNKATDWEPAPEDKQDSLQDIVGNVGVGKTNSSATEKLDVNGNVKATGFKTSTGTDTQALTANGGVFDLTKKADLVSGKIPTSQIPPYVIGNPHNTTATDVDALKRDGSNANSAVNIGAYYFESSQGFKKTGGTANQFLMADGSVNNTTYINTIGGNKVQDNWYITALYEGGRFSFVGDDYPALSWGQSVASMSDDGFFYLDYVGINQSSINNPNYFSGEVTIYNRLNVNGVFRLDNIFDFRSDSLKTASATVGIFGTRTGGANDFQLLFNRTAAGTGSYYEIQSVEQGIGYRDIVLQKAGGNVGIGIAPSQKLEVNGNVKATSFIKTGGTSTQILMADGNVIEKSDFYQVNKGGAGTQDSLVANGLQYLSIANTSTNFDGDLTNKTFEGTFANFNGSSNSNKSLGFTLAVPTSINQGIYYKTWYSASTPWRRLWDTSNFSQSNINNWNTAHGWGNHASAGYALATGTNATNNWSNTSSGLSINPSLPGKTLNASGQNVSLKDATYGMISGIVQDDTGSPLASQWSNRLKTLHNNSAGYFTELAQSFTGTEGVWHRRNSAGTISTWKQLYDDSIWNAATLSYSGSTLTLTINGISKTATINAGTSYTLPTASATVLGGVKLFSDTVQSVASNAVTTTASRTYSVQLNSSGQMVVNVPWVDTNTNTTYTAGNGLTLAGTVFSLPITVSGSGNYITDVTQTTNGITVTKGTLPTYTLPTASATILGGVKIGSGISIDGNGVISANSYTAGTNITISSNQISVVASPTFSGNVTASGFYESSLRKLKENILPFELSGLGLLSQLDIVTYDRIDKSSVNKIGIIADDSPEEFLSENRDSVDLYKTVFIQAKAIQELKSEVDELKEELNNLRDLITLNLNQF